MSTDPVFMKSGTQYYWYQNDQLGTPQMITTSSGAIVWSVKYTSFGKASVDIGSSVVNPLRFPGQYKDVETGLHYNYHRYYDSVSGRYLTADPIGLIGGMNLYAYVQNNVINFADPWGLLTDWEKGVLADRMEYLSQLRQKYDNLPGWKKLSDPDDLAGQIHWQVNAIEELLSKDCPGNDKENCELGCAAKGAAYIVAKVAWHEIKSVSLGRFRRQVVDKIAKVFRVGNKAKNVYKGVDTIARNIKGSIKEVEMASDIAKNTEAIMRNCLKNCGKNN